ncbi:MAG: lysophospholipid acyltransferase family protein [Eggerthellales bacterium]|nr:lysophospholipid acyltransferase family protein [Eggerthellales bacterium]
MSASDQMQCPHIVRNKRIVRAAKVLLKPLVGRLLHFKVTPYEPKAPAVLVLANHTHAADPVMLLLSFKPFVRLCSNEYLMRMAGIGTFLTWAIDPLVKRRGASSDSMVEAVLGTLRQGVSVAMHPEGRMSATGQTGYIGIRNAQLAQQAAEESGAGLVTYRFSGGFFCQPRWATTLRWGTVRGAVVREYAPEELLAMTEEELHRAICADLWQDAYEDLKAHPDPIRGKNFAERVENQLYLCPSCLGFGEMRSQGDALNCACGLSATMDEYCRFESRNPFENLLAWDTWQREYVASHAAEWKSHDSVIVTSTVEKVAVQPPRVESQAGSSAAAPGIHERCTLVVRGSGLAISSPDGWHVEASWPEISHMATSGKTRLAMTMGDSYLVVFGSESWCPGMVFDLYRALRDA